MRVGKVNFVGVPALHQRFRVLRQVVDRCIGRHVFRRQIGNRQRQTIDCELCGAGERADGERRARGECQFTAAAEGSERGGNANLYSAARRKVNGKCVGIRQFAKHCAAIQCYGSRTGNSCLAAEPAAAQVAVDRAVAHHHGCRAGDCAAAVATAAVYILGTGRVRHGIHAVDPIEAELAAVDFNLRVAGHGAAVAAAEDIAVDIAAVKADVCAAVQSVCIAAAVERKIDIGIARYADIGVALRCYIFVA